MSDELKPCPFCGGEAQTDFIEGESYLIECYVCRAETGIKDSEAEAIAAWNRRSTSGAASGEVVAYLAEDSDGNRGLSFKENVALRECEPGATVTPLVRGAAEPASQHDVDDVTCDQCIELEGALHREYARQAIAGIRTAARRLMRFEFRNGMEAACDEMEARLNLNDEQSSSAGAAKGGITNDNDSNSLATQSASTAPGQAEIPAQTGIETVPAKTGTSSETKGNGDE